jgi:hypothetical protein
MFTSVKLSDAELLPLDGDPGRLPETASLYRRKRELAARQELGLIALERDQVGLGQAPEVAFGLERADHRLQLGAVVAQQEEIDQAFRERLQLDRGGLIQRTAQILWIGHCQVGVEPRERAPVHLGEADVQQDLARRRSGDIVDHRAPAPQYCGSPQNATGRLYRGWRRSR